MDRIFKPNLTQINNVGLGQTFTADLPIGPAYRYIDVLVTMTTASSKTASTVADFLGLITLYVNGKAFRTFQASEAQSIYQMYSPTAAASVGNGDYGPVIGTTTGSNNTLMWTTSSATGNGTLTGAAANSQTTCAFRIFFEEDWRKDWAPAASRKFFTSWPAAKAGGAAQTLSSFQIQAQIPSTTNNAGATSLSVYIYAGTDNSQGPLDASGNPVTNCLKWYRFPGFTYSAGGDQQIQNVVRYNKGQQLAILEEMDIFSQFTSSNPDPLQRVQVNADGRITYDATQLANNRELTAHGFDVPYNPAFFPIIFDANDVITDGLFLSTQNGSYVNNLIVTATLPGTLTSDNKTLVVISQVYGPLD